MDKLLGTKTERPEEISTQDVLSVLKVSKSGGATKKYSTDDFIEFESYAVFDLHDGAQLIKSGRIHMVNISSGIVFMIRKLDGKSIDTREARTAEEWTFEEYAKKCINYTNFSYVDIDVDTNGYKINVEPIREDVKYSVEELGKLLRSDMKD